MRAWGRAIRTRLGRLQGRGLLLFATIPFALMINSSQVSMNLKIEADGGALRQITADASPYISGQIPKWVNDVQAGGSWDRLGRTTGPNSISYARDFRTQNANYSDGQLQIVDVLQNPLSLYTTYAWKEDINFAYTNESDPLAAAGASKQLAYTVRMPGRVTDSSVQPLTDSSVSNEGNAAIFKLAASQQKVSITVTSAKLRWGYLLVVLYALAWVALEVLGFIGRIVRRRPRKI